MSYRQQFCHHDFARQQHTNFMFFVTIIFIGYKELVLNMDNGPECSGRRSQFLYRMTTFADMAGFGIRLIYYPPYHSKYNNIERYWAGLEKSWNGYFLESVATIITRSCKFTWRGIAARAMLVYTIYQKVIKRYFKGKTNLEKRLTRSSNLRWWYISIRQKSVFLQ